MKIINLLNKIANGEEVPKKIKYRNNIYEYEGSDYFGNDIGYLFERYNLTAILNDEVEIIEEEKKLPEKLEPLQKDYMTLDDIKFTFSNSEMIIVDKINAILDYLESKGE